MKPWHLWVSIAAILAAGFLVSQDAIARLAWHRYGRADVALMLNRQDAGLAMQLGNYYFNGGAYDLQKTERAYRKALAINPSAPRAHYQLGRIHFLNGKFFVAMDEINAEIALYPEFPNAFYVRGLIEGYRGRYGEAASDFQTFVDRMPSNWAGYNDLAWIQIKQKEFSAALRTIELAFDRYPDWRAQNLWLLTSYGVAKMNLGEHAVAEEAFRSALSIANNTTPEYFWSAYPGNDPQHAPSAFDQYMASLFFNLGLANENLGNFKEAERFYRQFLAAFPDKNASEYRAGEEKIKAFAKSGLQPAQ